MRKGSFSRSLKILTMFEYSVITPVADKERTFFIVPLSKEDQFVDTDCDSGVYEYARLDLMLEIMNGYQANLHHASGVFETEHYLYSREQLSEGMVARVTAK